MIVLGIDPGYAIVGFGAVDYDGMNFKPITYGAITTSSKTDFNTRLEQIYDSVDTIIKRTNPQAMAIEKIYFQNNQKTAINVAQARGVIMLAAQKNNLTVFEYTPLQIKTAVTGYGVAKKEQVMDMTTRLLNLKEVPKPDDTADALAIAISHIQATSTNLRLQMYKRGIK